MQLSESTKKKLTDRGILLLEKPNRCLVVKKPGIGGNSLPNRVRIPITGLTENDETDNSLTSDCPFMQLWYGPVKFDLVCWNWVPGPGPGDFEKEFTNEDELVDFILSYYFGENEYFEARRQYEEKLLKEKK